MTRDTALNDLDESDKFALIDEAADLLGKPRSDGNQGPVGGLICPTSENGLRRSLWPPRIQWPVFPAARQRWISLGRF